MKQLHRPDLFAWSIYDEGQQVDFNGLLWKREGGNVVVDPVPLADHDWKHLAELGGAAWIVVTNSAHVRAAREVAEYRGGVLEDERELAVCLRAVQLPYDEARYRLVAVREPPFARDRKRFALTGGAE